MANLLSVKKLSIFIAYVGIGILFNDTLIMAQKIVDAQVDTSGNIKERELRQKVIQIIQQHQVRKNAFIKPDSNIVTRPKLAQQIQEALNQQFTVTKRRDNRYIPARDLASESAKSTKAVVEKNRQEIISAFQRIDQERLAEFDLQNAEIKRRFEEFLKNVDKNLPQKGQHKDYSTYNNSFKPIVRK